MIVENQNAPSIKLLNILIESNIPFNFKNNSFVIALTYNENLIVTEWKKIKEEQQFLNLLKKEIDKFNLPINNLLYQVQQYLFNKNCIKIIKEYDW